MSKKVVKQVVEPIISEEQAIETLTELFKPADVLEGVDISGDEPVSLSELVHDELTDLKLEQDTLTEKLKANKKRIRELTKGVKPAGEPSKKSQGLSWLIAHPDSTINEWISYAMNTLEMSPIYGNTIWKLYKKG